MQYDEPREALVEGQQLSQKYKNKIVNKILKEEFLQSTLLTENFSTILSSQIIEKLQNDKDFHLTENFSLKNSVLSHCEFTNRMMEEKMDSGDDELDNMEWNAAKFSRGRRTQVTKDDNFDGFFTMTG